MLADRTTRIGVSPTMKVAAEAIKLKAQGVELAQEADESTSGPASFIAVDPDGNSIFVDQHV